MSAPTIDVLSIIDNLIFDSDIPRSAAKWKEMRAARDAVAGMIETLAAMKQKDAGSFCKTNAKYSF